MNISGKVWKYGDNIDTDVIYPGKYLVHFDPEEVAKHVMEGMGDGFAEKVQKGDLIVAGQNFGTGSAREQAAMALRYAGLAAILADSFSRTFFRNAINNALPVVAVKGISKWVEEGEELEVELTKGIIRKVNTGEELKFIPHPQLIMDIVNAGGAINYYKEKNK